MQISTEANKDFQELNPLFGGYEQCAPEYAFGPCIRDYYLIHYVLQGRGCYWAEGKKFCLEKGEYFLIRPGQLATYRADGENPWYYVWIGFNGRLAQDFQRLPLAGKISPGAFHEIRRIEEAGSLKKEYLTRILFQIYCELFKDRKREKDYAAEVYEYIQYNYMTRITVEELAAMVSLDRRYLSRLFKARYGKSLKQFLTEYRMERAEHFLQEGQSVSRVADLVGYGDVCGFSKMFKKVRGRSPAECRQRL